MQTVAASGASVDEVLGHLPFPDHGCRATMPAHHDDYGAPLMNMPAFTAEASLYQTTGYYRTTENAVSLSAQEANGIYSAMVGEETIEIHSCAPGWTDIGGRCWPNPLTEPTGGGGGNTPSPGDIEEGNGPGGTQVGGRRQRAPDQPKLCSQKAKDSQVHKDCVDETIKDASQNRAPETWHYARCVNDRMGRELVACCHNYFDENAKRTKRACTTSVRV